MVSKSFLKTWLRRLYQEVWQRTVSEVDGEELKQSAIVFSPHPDDETLGCGGTIIRKKSAGAAVKIVFMTDGRQSHKQFISEEALKAIRTGEALAASQMLGVVGSDVLFLDFQDGVLCKYQDLAIQRVTELLWQNQPAQVFVPHHKEPPPDHLATYQIVRSALRAYDNNVTIYEYPVWLWQHWPWAGLPVLSRRRMLSIFRQNIVSSLSLLADLRHRVYIGDILELKRAALNQHKSQMTRLIPDPGWLTLAHVSNGEFLECFFQEHELFYRYDSRCKI